MGTLNTSPAHSEIGASSMYRWENCPGSVRLSRGIESVSSAYAEEGTLAHEVAAHLLEHNRWPESVPYDSAMQDAVKVYIEHVKGIIGNDGWAGKVYVEHRFDLSAYHPGLFGTADCVIYSSATRTLYVLDYKHGQGIPVEVHEHGEPNPQLMYYGLGALSTLPHEVDRVVLTIVQPRCFHVDGPVRSLELKAEDVFDFAFRVSKKASDTQKDNAPLVAGDWCGFCPAKGTCPELHKTATEVAKREFGTHLSYDPALLSDTLSKLSAVEAWAKGVKAFAYSELEHGREIPGYKLVQKRATRRWKDEREAEEKLCALLPSSLELWDRSLKSVAQVEKLLPKEHKAILADLCSKESSGYALAPAHDPRPAAKVDAKSEFQTIPEMESNQTMEST